MPKNDTLKGLQNKKKQLDAKLCVANDQTAMSETYMSTLLCKDVDTEGLEKLLDVFDTCAIAESMILLHSWKKRLTNWTWKSDVHYAMTR